MTCKYYNEEICSENCNQDWCICDLCKRYLDPSIDEEINSYIICSGITYCDSSDIEDREMVICPECFKKIKNY